MPKPDNMPVLTFEDAADWERWLASSGATSSGIWLRIAKKDASSRTVAYSEAVDVALCYGWIDGRKRPLDSEFWLQAFSPRGPRSIWSARNRQRAQELIRSGKMKRAGLAVVEAAKASGRWEKAYASQRTAEVPPDLAAALKANKRAQAFFQTLDSRSRYAILFRLHNAVRPETRRRRLEKFLVMLAKGEKIYP